MLKGLKNTRTKWHIGKISPMPSPDSTPSPGGHVFFVCLFLFCFVFFLVEGNQRTFLQNYGEIGQVISNKKSFKVVSFGCHDNQTNVCFQKLLFSA